MSDAFKRLVGEFAAKLAKELVESSFERLAKRDEPPSKVVEVEAVRVEPEEMPAGSRLSRRRCPACGGPLFFRSVMSAPGAAHMWYWCRGSCSYGKFETCSDATNFEGIPI